jgi:two-component system sensor histidine kinase BaeS
VTARFPRPWRTLGGRLALGFTAGLLLAAGIFTVVGTSLIRAQTERAARSELDRQAEAVAQLVSARAQRAAEANRCPDLGVANLQRLVGREAHLYYQGLPFCPQKPNNPTGGLPKVASAQISPDQLAQDGVQRIDFTPPGAHRTFQASAAPILIGGQTFGTVVLARPPSKIGSPLPSVLGGVLAAAAIGLAVALALVLLLTRRVTRPLRRMEQATRQVAAGNLGVTLPAGGPEELDGLAVAFNAMVQKLAERDELARDFLMRVTHDLRTPLTAIRGHAAALSDGIVSDADVPRSLGAIEAEAGRLETLVSDLLDLARLDAHRFRLELAEVEAGELLEQAFEAFASEAGRRGIRYELQLAPLDPLVTDGARVRQIVANLLDNALRWTPEDGEVRLEAAPGPTGGLIVNVSDTGPGVSPEEVEAIFEPFRSSTTPDGRTGTGLGLAISRQLARALSGDLTVESRPGAGSRFSLSLPARAEQLAPALA